MRSPRPHSAVGPGSPSTGEPGLASQTSSSRQVSVSWSVRLTGARPPGPLRQPAGPAAFTALVTSSDTSSCAESERPSSPQPRSVWPSRRRALGTADG